jgi:hypothetical protein
MRSPFRKAVLWLLAALSGAVAAGAAWWLSPGQDALLPVALGVIGMGLGPIALVMALTSALSGLGAWRLARGQGEIARWHIAPAAWEAFRAFAARRAAEPSALPEDAALRPATAPVEVRFGRRQVMLDGSYHPLRRFGIPEIAQLAWLQPPDAPECLEFTLSYPRGRHGGTLRTALRIPVAPDRREDAVRVFGHFRASVPAQRVGLAFRRPWLVLGWAAGVTLACALAGATGWWLATQGMQGEAVAVLGIFGMMGAIGGAVFMLIILLVVQPWRRGSG